MVKKIWPVNLDGHFAGNIAGKMTVGFAVEFDRSTFLIIA